MENMNQMSAQGLALSPQLIEVKYNKNDPKNNKRPSVQENRRNSIEKSSEDKYGHTNITATKESNFGHQKIVNNTQPNQKKYRNVQKNDNQNNQMQNAKNSRVNDIFERKKRSSKLQSFINNSNAKGGGLQIANWNLALQRRNKISNRYYKGQQVSMFCDFDHLCRYGSGIALFFDFLKSLSFTLFVVAAVSFVPIIYNYTYGNGLQNRTVSLSFYFAKTTIANFNWKKQNYLANSKYFNTISDMVCMFVYIVFYFYWLKRGNEITQNIRKTVKLRSYFTLQLIQFPKQAQIKQIRQYMSQFGQVQEIAPVNQYQQTINLSKIIYDLQMSIKQLQIKKQQESTLQYDKQITQKSMQTQQIYKQLLLYQNDTKQNTIKYYVVFNSIQARQEALKQIYPHQKRFCQCFGDKTPENMKLLGQKIIVQPCFTQPGEIIWQNQHVTWKSRWLRSLIQTFFLFILVLIGFFLISFLNILTPPATNVIDTSSYNENSITLITNASIIQTWCINNVGDVIGKGTSSSIFLFCKEDIIKYYTRIAIGVGISVAVIVAKVLIKAFVIWLAKFQRYKTHTDQSVDIVKNLFVTYLCTTVLITFLLQAKTFGISFKYFISIFVNDGQLYNNLKSLKQYNDFDPDWYIDIGYQICLTWIIMSVHPTLTMPFAHFIQQQLAYCSAQKQQIQAKMQKKIQPMTFQLQDNYANILMILFVSLAFSGGMPIISVAAFLAIWLRYMYYKYIFIRYCRVPKTYNEAIDIKVISLLPYAFCIHFMFAIWMYGNDKLLSPDKFFLTTTINQGSLELVTKMKFLIQRVYDTWYYSMFFILILGIFVFKVVLYNFLIKSISGNNKQMIKVEQIQQLNLSSHELCNSYKIENNPDYVEVLQIMYKKKKYSN